MGRTKPAGLRLRWQALAFAVLAAILWVGIATRDQPFNPHDADKVRPGMTLAEVTELFGSRRPDREFMIPDEPHSLEGLPPLPEQPDQTAAWETHPGVIIVYFARGRAIGTVADWNGPEPFWARLRRWGRLDF
jgi:hypothetical protein